MYILYKTTNLINNNYYIGKHKQKDGLCENTFDGYLGSGIRLKYAIKKYGKNNFIRETISSSDCHDEISNLEFEYITDELINNDNCYNIGKGGQGGNIKSPAAIKKLSNDFKINNPIHTILKDPIKYKEWLEKVSIGSKIGQAKSEKYKLANIKHTNRFNSDKNPGKNPSLETRKKMSLARMGKPQPKGKDSPNFGKRYKLSEEKRNNIANGIRKAREKEIHFCEICNITVKSNANWGRHINGKKHLKANSLVT